MNYYIELSDKRNMCLFEQMNMMGYSVHSLADFQQKAEKRQSCGYIFSPARKFKPIDLEALENDSTIFAGKIDDECKALLADKGIEHKNFMESDQFALKNAVLTAEAVLSLCIQKTKKSIFDCKILILGYGKCARAIASLFDGLSLNYSVCMRDTKKMAKNVTTKNVTNVTTFSFSELTHELANFDLIINTVPSKIIDDDMILLIDERTVFIEIASINCLDKDRAKFEYYPSPALPQAYSEQSAAKLMLEFIIAES